MLKLLLSAVIFLIFSPTYADEVPLYPFTNENPKLDFLRPAIGDRSIVQLGEGIHVTRELPIIRLEFVKFLHKQLGFDVIAYEGSMVDSWIATDDLLRGETIELVQRRAWFPLWQTEEMGRTLEYIKSTLSTSNPLYLTSFDIQTGSAGAFGNSENIVDALISRINAYGSHLDSTALRPLLQLRNCHQTITDAVSVTKSIGTLAKAIQLVAPNIKNVAHRNALFLLPENLTARLNHCLLAEGKGLKREYQEARDRANAEMVLALKQKVSVRNKIILWAHHSHVHHNALKEHPYSMGEALKENSPTDLYTIGFFAGQGRMLAVSDEEIFPLWVQRIDLSTKFDFERSLKKMGHELFFADLTSAEPTAIASLGWDKKIASSVEGFGPYWIIPNQDFNAVVYVDTVSAAVLTPLPPIMKALSHIYGFWKAFRLWIISTLIVLTGLVAFKFIRRKNRILKI